jgi:serine/threonine protein kinase
MNDPSAMTNDFYFDQILADLRSDHRDWQNDQNRDDFRFAITAHECLAEMLDTNSSLQVVSDVDRLPPNLTDRYEIEKELGKGGMGVVYLARQKSLNRHVAIKVLKFQGRDSGQLLKRFRDEAQHLARLRHPHIVSIHEVGEVEGEPYFTMEYIDGEPLSSLIAKGPISPTRAVAIIKQVATAIQHAHQQGIIHRDLKPANVLVDHTGHVYVTDFGLARDLRTDSNLTQSNEILGTPQYMSPEQARGQSNLFGEGTDIHALGLILYEMLAGKPAFTASSAADVLVKLLHEEPASLRKQDRRIPQDLETICQKSLEKKSQARYANVTALLEDLRRFENGEPLLAKRVSPLTRLWRWSARHWRIGSAIVLTAVIMMMVVPRLNDKSFDELMEWGSEELRSFRAPVAAQIFQRAYSIGQGSQKDLALQRLADAISEIYDPATALDLAQQVMTKDSRLSFGKHDYLVAQKCVLNARQQMPNEAFETVHGKLTPSAHQACKLAAERLAIFLDGTWGDGDERREAEQWLASIQKLARQEFPLERWSPDELATLPIGSREELLKQFRDINMSLWDRGRAAMALGRLAEIEGSQREAELRFRQALETMQSVFPFVSGVSSESQSRHQLGRTSGAPECRLLQELLADIQRLNPANRSMPEGGLKLSIQPSDWVDEIELGIMLEMFHPAVKDPKQGLPRSLSRHVYVSTKAPKEVRVLDGIYRLKFVGSSRYWSSVDGIDPELIEIEVADWPHVVEIKGNWVELPPVSLKKLQEIELVRPAELAQTDLKHLRMEWSPVAGAAKYAIQMGHFIDNPHPQSIWFTTIQTEVPHLILNQLEGAQRDAVATHWKTGRIAGVRVQAMSADGRRLAVSKSDRRFLITGGLEKR